MTMHVGMYTTGLNAQRNTSAVRGQWTQLLRLQLPTRPGDIVDADAFQEISSNEPYPNGSPALVSAMLFLASDPALVQPEHAFLIIGQDTTNLTPAAHHKVFKCSGKVVVPPGNGPWFLIMVASYDGDSEINDDGTIEGGECGGAIMATVTTNTTS